MTFAHEYTDLTTYIIRGSDGRVYSANDEGYVEFCQTNTPEKTSGDRFVSIVNGEVVIDPNKETTLVAEAKEALIKDFDIKIQALLDAQAQAKGYDNIISACCYASVDNLYQAEGQAAVRGRANTWAYCYLVMADVENGLRPVPTFEELAAELPPIVWPA